MKKIAIKMFRGSIVIGIISISVFLSVKSDAQQITNKGKEQVETKKSVSKAGQSLHQNKTEAHTVRKEGTAPVPFATCSDMGAESGWGSWTAADGYFQYGGSPYPVFFGFGAPAAPRFNITSGAGVDPCTQGTLGPTVPVVCPGFGNASIQLGQPNTNGLNGGCTSSGQYPGPGTGAAGNGCSEKLKYPLTVSALDTNFIYAFAIVVENPAGGHTISEAPFAEIYMLDQIGDTVACSHQKYIADLNGGVSPGFFKASCAGSVSTGYPPNGMIVSYKPWTYVGINLSAYLGQTLTVIITNSDCALGGHYCYSYWDFACPPLTGAVAPFCLGQQTTVVGPPSDPSNPYTYTWYQNHQVYTGPPSATSQSITPTPAVGDTFAVHVHQQSGCDFWMPFAPQLLSINANFTLANNCGTVSFTDGSTSPSAGPITSWNWSFPGATPVSSTSQNPSVTYTTTGTHSVTLTVTSSMGCTATKVLTVTTVNPVANFNTGPVCLGETTTFSDNSTASPGDPVSAWGWNFGDGTANSTTQNPTHSYSTTGTFTVTQVISTQAGCKDSIKIPVTVNALPQAAFSSTTVCAGSPTQLTDSSVPPAGGTLTWIWNLPGGNPASSSAQNPAVSYTASGTYSVSLIVTTQAGCKDTVILPVVVNALPQAAFSSNTVCAGNVTSLTDNSVPPAGESISSYSWSFPSGNPVSSTSQNPTVTFPAGTYNATFVITASNGCTNSVVHPVTVRGLPIADFNFNSPCMGNLTSLLNTSASPSGDPIASWSWNMAGGIPATSTTQNASTNYNTSGTHTVTLTVTTQGGCKDTISHPVLIYSPPIANFSGSGAGCAPICVSNYTDSSTAAIGNNITSWVWTFPGGTPSTSSQQNPPSICYNVPGSYGANLVVTTANGCKDSISIYPLVNTYPTPNADFCIDHTQAPATDPVFTFCPLWTPNPGVTNWVWNFGDGSPLDSTSTNPVHNYTLAAVSNDFSFYTVTLLVKNQYGCWDTISKVVELIPEFEFYIPNCFTPNQDGNNEFFFGKGRGIKDYNIWVFDRWGNTIWDCHYNGKNTLWDNSGQDGMPSACKWDGIVVKGGLDMNGNSGQLAQEDVYVWKVKLTDIFDKMHTYIGHVSIVK